MKSNMHKWVRRALIFAAALMITFSAAAPMTAVQAQAAGTRKAATAARTKNGKIKENGKYYFYNKGVKVKNTWKKIGGKWYYFGADGAAKTGWYTAKKSGKWATYYFTSAGVMQAKKTQAIKKDLVTQMDKRIRTSGVTAKTKPAEALKLIYASMTGSEFRYGSDARTETAKIAAGKNKKFVNAFALSTLKKHTGSCFGYAAAYAATARRATGLPVRVCVGTSTVLTGKQQIHAWTEVKVGGKWLVFDTNAQQYSRTVDTSENAEAFCGIAADKSKYQSKFKVNVNL